MKKLLLVITIFNTILSNVAVKNLIYTSAHSLKQYAARYAQIMARRYKSTQITESDLCKIAWGFLDNLDAFIKKFEKSYSQYLIENNIIDNEMSCYILANILASRQIDISKLDFSAFKEYLKIVKEKKEELSKLAQEVALHDNIIIIPKKLASRAEVLENLEFILNVSLNNSHASRSHGSTRLSARSTMIFAGHAGHYCLPVEALAKTGAILSLTKESRSVSRDKINFK